MTKKHSILVALLLVFLSFIFIFNYRLNNIVDAKSEETTQTAERFKESKRTVYVYAKRKNLHSKKKLPLILYLNSTGGNPRKEPISTGWAKLAKKENLVVVSPDYNNAVTYDEVPFFMRVVNDAKRRYNIDDKRVYVLGFSNGGASAVALTSTHPKTFAGIAAYGW